MGLQGLDPLATHLFLLTPPSFLLASHSANPFPARYA